MSLQLTINLEFLQKIEPPSAFPPNQDEMMMQLESKFLSECERFINNQKMLYKCSKAIESRLNRIMVSSLDIEKKLSSEKEKLDFIAYQLRKYRHQELELKEKEKILRMLCELIRMEDLRKDLLLGEYKKEALEIEPKPIVVNEEEYLYKLERLNEIIKESQSITQFKSQFPLVKEIILELENISKNAIKFIIKRLLTPKMIELILNQFNHLFTNDVDSPILTAVVNSRLQNLKISLNPMINNLNYATNIPELYDSILQLWSNLIEKQVNLFRNSQRFDLVRTINTMLMSDLLPKIEKNIFKVKDWVSLVSIRKSYSNFLNFLQKITQWKSEQKNEGINWELLTSALSKCEILIASILTQQSQSLENAKYNIYTMTSYIPIREHLQKIKFSYEFSIEEQKLDWQVGFYNLCSSRDPKNYPNNKSLIIFNLNIWYLYLKIIHNGKHRKEGEELIKWCTNTFTTINVQETNKKYYESFEKILQLCGNLPVFKTTLFAQVNLLGHEDLRNEVVKSIKTKYIQNYLQTLAKIEKNPMTNEEVKTFCQSKKINLNKFGKYSHSICIYSGQALEELLEY